jgi:hypothetical protein
VVAAGVTAELGDDTPVGVEVFGSVFGGCVGDEDS